MRQVSFSSSDNSSVYIFKGSSYHGGGGGGLVFPNGGGIGSSLREFRDNNNRGFEESGVKLQC